MVRAFAYTNQARAAPSGSLELSATEVFDAQNRKNTKNSKKKGGLHYNNVSVLVRACH